MPITSNLLFAQHAMNIATISVVICLFVFSQTFASEDPMMTKVASEPTIVIVHGAWGGAHQWRKVAAVLQKATGGHVHRVTLTGQGERVHLASPKNDLSTHIQDVVNVIQYEQLDAVVLVGHSYGGAVISGVADQIPGKISQLIYLDAMLLEDGESCFDLIPQKRDHYTGRAKEDGGGWLIPIDWEEATPFGDVPHQLATLTTKISLKNTDRLKIQSAYWLFADGKPAEQDERHKFFKRAEALHWQTRVFSWDHNPQKSHPEELGKELSRNVTRQTSRPSQTSDQN